MRRLTMPAIGLVMAVVMAAPATVEGQQMRPWEISIAGGPTLVTGEFSDEASTGFHVQGSIGFDLGALPLGTRFDVMWQEVPDRVDGWFRQIGLLGNATFTLPLAFIEPYGLIGAGLLRTTSPETDHGDHAHAGETENLIGFNAGAGLEFPFAGLRGFVEARYLNIFGSGEADHFRTIPISFGIRF